jgi:heavy metal translocating P-type ATPase
MSEQQQKVSQLYVGGMACAFCASTIEKGLRHVDGVRSVKVLLESGEVFIRHDPSLVDKSRLKTQLQDLGYYVFEGKQNASAQVLADSSKRAIKTWMLVGISFLLVSPMMFPYVFGTAILAPPIYNLFAPWANFLIATIALFYLALPIQKGAVVALRMGILNEHVLYGVAGFGAYALGIAGLFLQQYGEYKPFLFIAILLTGLHLTAGWLGALLRHKAEQSVSKLMDLRPPKARVLRAGSEALVAVSELHAGDLILVKPGEKVPLDGVVIDGKSEVSEAILTGEATPIVKHVNDDVLGGSTNGSGALTIKVTSDYSGSYISRIFNLIDSAKESRSAILTFFDKVVDRVWVPLVLLISFGSFAAWMVLGLLANGLPYWQFGLVSGLLVMVIGYPCAIGFSSPSVGLSVFSEYADNGVIIKDLSLFEKLKDVKTAIFDKTGTLTYSTPKIIQMTASDRVDENTLLKYAASVEKESSHPIAKAIVDEEEMRGIPIADCEDFKQVSGAGVVGIVESRKVVVGTPEFVVSNGAKREDVRQVLESFTNPPESAIVVTADGFVMGAFDIADKVRDDAKPVVDLMKRRGISVLMLTGDSKQAASQVSAKLGGIKFLARQSPDDKIVVVQEFKQKGKVLMVGDGINDAASLAAADVGIATAASIDVSKDVADAVLVSGGLSGVVMLIENARMNANASAENVLLALSFNAVGMPLAIMGVLSVPIAMGIMVASLLGVFLNAYVVKLRLKGHLTVARLGMRQKT